MSLLGLMVRHHKQIITPPPPPNTALAIPAGAVNGWGTAADFYDSVGVNVHWKPNGAYGNPPTLIQDVAFLGARHVRAEVTGSWWSSVYQYYRAANIPIRNRNAALPAVTATDRGQPIFCSIHTTGYPGFYPANFSNDYPFSIDDWYDMFEGGRQHWQPQFNRVPIPNGTTSNPDATVPNPWNFNDPEMDWSIIGQICSANEPDLTNPSALKPWTKELFDKKKPRTTTPAFGGLPAVTTAGVRSNCTISQVPVVGPAIINNGVGNAVGDMSLGTNVCDLGDNHPYWVGMEPSHEKVTEDLTTTGVTYNGNLASPPSASKALPMVMTEYGHISSAGNWGLNSHDGYWAAPDDVIAEYAARIFVLHYSRGIRRTYWYELYNTTGTQDGNYNANDPENFFGLLDRNRVKKQQFYSIRNLLRIVGFTEPADAARQKLPITVTGFVPQGNHWDPGTNTMVADGSGQNHHYAMSGQGAGGYYKNYADRLDVLQLQQSDDTWLLILMRQAALWDREPGNWNISTNQPQVLGNVAGARFTPNTQNLTVTLPAGVTAVSQATPTAGGATTPDDGFAFSALTITGNTVTVPIAGKMKVLKIVKSAAPAPTNLPVVVPSAGATPAVLRKGTSAGPRLQLKGVQVWGLQDTVTGSFGTDQYNNRVSIAAQIKSWGANLVRFRVLADDYNAAPSAAMGNLNKLQILQRIAQWRDAVVGQGMYFCPCAWDPLDPVGGPNAGAGWAGKGNLVHSMFTEIYTVLGNDEMVFYEPYNEPNNVTFGDGTGSGQWDTNIRGAILHFRETIGYKGLLVIDPVNWANSGTGGSGYSNSVYNNIEAYDAARAGMGGLHQIAWAKHDYANEYSGMVWDPAAWNTGQGGSQINHLIFETEFGNYNGSPSTVSPTWSANAAAFFDDRLATQQNYVGGVAFLWGPWYDANALTTADNATPTVWGQSVKTNFLQGQAVTPPAQGFSPGLHGGDSGSVTPATNLGAKVERVGRDITDTASSLDSIIGAFADQGIRVLLLAEFQGFPSNLPSAVQAQNVATWATRFGPGGTFWTGGRAGQANLAVQHIEFGNETNYGYQSGDQNAGGYATVAQTYAQRFQTAYTAVQSANPQVGLMCQGVPTDSNTLNWLNNMFSAVPSLASLVSGWTVHPYGPDYINRLAGTANTSMVSQLAAHGVATSAPIDITELGLASKENPAGTVITLDDNYGWSNSMSYAQAASTIQTITQNITNHTSLNNRLRHYIIYGSKDGLPVSNSSVSKFSYFGVVQADGTTAKGAYTPAVQTILNS